MVFRTPAPKFLLAKFLGIEPGGTLTLKQWLESLLAQFPKIKPGETSNSHQGLLLLGQWFRKPHIFTTFCSKNAISTCCTLTKLYSPVKNLQGFLRVKYHLSSPSGTYLSTNPRWHFWGRGSENHTFWALFALKMQLLLDTPSPNFAVQFVLSRPSFV